MVKNKEEIPADKLDDVAPVAAQSVLGENPSNPAPANQAAVTEEEYEGAKEVYKKLGDLFDWSGFRHVPGDPHDQLSGLKGPNGWARNYKTSIGGYSDHLSFINNQGASEGLQTEIRLTKKGPYESGRDEIAVIFSDSVKSPSGVYRRSQEDGLTYFRIKDGQILNAILRDKDERPLPFTQDEFDKFKVALDALYFDAQAASRG